MIVGIQFHRVLSYDKLFCRCRFQKNLSSSPIEFKVRYPSLGIVHRYHTFTHNCEYEKEQIPSELNLKLVQKAVNCCYSIPGVKLLTRGFFNRKHIYDNSIPHGYQKTACIATGGYIELSEGKRVLIDKIYLQEDSCTRQNSVYNVNRLGLPLLQVATLPTQLNAQQVRQLCVKLDQLLNWKYNLPLCSFSRRQDVNLSIEGHPKVQFKGLDRLSLIAPVMQKQNLRQIDNLKDNLVVSSTRYVLKDGSSTHLRYTQSKQRMHRQTQIPIFKIKYSKKLRSKLKLFEKYRDSSYTIPSFVNNSQLKKFNLVFNEHQLGQTEIEYYFTRSKKMFKAYLNGEISETALRRNTWVKAKDHNTLNSLWREYSKERDFFSNQKIYFPRGYKPPKY